MKREMIREEDFLVYFPWWYIILFFLSWMTTTTYKLLINYVRLQYKLII